MKRVAIQGIEGSYSDEAALQMLRSTVDILECKSFDLAIDAVLQGSGDMAVIPVENKIVGRIEPAAGLVENSSVKILDQCRLTIEHMLIGTASARFESLASVSSHVQALRQCGKFLNGHPKLSQIVGGDTASCVKSVVEIGDKSMAAIGSRRAAEIYGGKVVLENIADEPGNWTRFVLVGRD